MSNGKNNQLKVDDFSPNPAQARETLTIQGSEFDPDQKKNQVFIGGVETKEIESAKENELKVKTPFNAQPGKVKVCVGQDCGESSDVLAIPTSISGITRDTDNNTPIEGVPVFVFLSNPLISDNTDADGEFVLVYVQPGLQRVVIAPDLSSQPLPYPAVIFKINVIADRDNFAGVIYLKKFGRTQQNTFTFDSRAHTITEGGVIFEIADKTTAIFPSRRMDRTIYLNLVAPDRTPVKLPDGVSSCTIAQLAPFGVKLTPGGKLTFPNTDNLPPNSRPRLYRLDQTINSPTLGEFVDAGPASFEGDKIVTAPDAITETGIFFVAAPLSEKNRQD